MKKTFSMMNIRSGMNVGGRPEKTCSVLEQVKSKSKLSDL